ncbi:MAG: phosphate signaling complex protein PhoU [Desulfomonile sp.]|jgi:phosphate transport system protein|nr:phosphate signaling complex protein PhoU [Deltaproteobacteria bacterium]
MRIRLQKDIERLNKSVASLGTLVEERFRMSVKAIEFRDAELARKVIEGDLEIDQREVDLEEECLKILALHQPVADQLRYIVAVLKLNNDLERIGDLAVNIAGSVELIAEYRHIQIPFDYFQMAESAQQMLEKSLDSLMKRDIDLAYQVCAQDDEVDIMKKRLQTQFAKEVCANYGQMEAMTELFLVSRHLERIADHATNIAEDVIYMIGGAIHRHRGPLYE